MTQLRRAAIVAPIRTAVGKFGGALSSLTAGELGGIVLKALMDRTKIDPARVDDVVFAQGYGNGEAPCIAHWSWLAAGLPLEVPGYQLDRRCGSGLQAIVNAAMMVQTGVSDVVVAGGVESMSNVEHYSIDVRKGVRDGQHDAARPVDARPRDEPADRALRRHQRHDRNRRKPRERLWHQPRSL
jgi:acetyl-CoA C-acetyltransferase